MTKPSGARPADVDHLAWLEASGIRFLPGLAMLDLGCGSGYLCEAAAKASARHAIGVDILPPDVKPTGWRHEMVDLNAKNWHSQLSKPDAGKGHFDLITAFDIIEHLESPVSFLENCRSLLASNGVLVLTTPNTSSWERLLRPDTWSGATDVQHRVLFNRYSLNFLLQRVGFVPRSTIAPVRLLGPLASLAPQVGGQIFSVADVKSN